MRRTVSTKKQRAFLAAIVAAIALVLFAVTGGLSVAGNSISAAQYQYDKVTICHVTGAGEVTITVAAQAVPAHLRHGDTIGAC